MCGITGFIHNLSADARDFGQKMAASMIHRGPDSQGVWTGDDICLAHARLSILDLSDAGSQPMLSACERFAIVYNGEVYNHLELREKLPAHNYRGHSDTETILQAFSQWGVEKTINELNGMFAIALWDRQKKELHLIRDRIGIKPLFYGWVAGAFVFGSELKPIRLFPGFTPRISHDNLALYLRYNYYPCPYSVYEDIYKLPQGTHLTVTSRNKPADFSPLADKSENSPKSYWSLEEVTMAAMANPFTGSIEEAENELDSLLSKAVSSRMLSDVSLGAFLSGGIDSSVTVAMMQKNSTKPVKTFTIGNTEKNYNEAYYASEVANHLGTDHTELYIEPADALAVVPKLSGIYDEPFADSSQIPTFLVSKLARQEVTVALSGDGGDELFAGYRRHFQAAPFFNKTRRLPSALRRIISGTGRFYVSSGIADLTSRYAPFLLPKSFRSGSVTDSIIKAADVLDAESAQEYYTRLISQNQNPADIIKGAPQPPQIFALPGFINNDIRKMMYMDLISYHPDDILVKVDRASMANSLEARVPLIDYHIVEFAARLPFSFMINQGRGKYLLRRVLARYVPPHLTDRPKMGFSIPLDSWLRNDLRDWCEELLSEKTLNDNSLLNTKAIRKMWDNHLTSREDCKYQLWAVLMLQSWIKGL